MVTRQPRDTRFSVVSTPMRPLPTITTSWARGVEMTADAFRITHAVRREYVGEVRAGSDGLNWAGAGGQHQFVVGNGRGASAVA